MDLVVAYVPSGGHNKQYMRLVHKSWNCWSASAVLAGAVRKEISPAGFQAFLSFEHIGRIGCGDWYQKMSSNL